MQTFPVIASVSEAMTGAGSLEPSNSESMKAEGFSQEPFGLHASRRVIANEKGATLFG
ncbi:MAG TPA: hypothetical protein VGU70_11630 [Methylobacterium sp.]|jgi:hypothetical protein|uniref:hypothetical protein n=1 Tax=Methylorubrum sp. B1-46 TaxID=2897334 RepID=UPI001E3A2957|nr:hypothetical protein [Methylorubrum sp. B1-46]UGB25464.1 hypothetical protein LPC10_21630 [Methylorubrum sp. B1-46]HEV2543395.1 hypothetical protein [Methylobacterium sp.]